MQDNQVIRVDECKMNETLWWDGMLDILIVTNAEIVIWIDDPSVE